MKMKILCSLWIAAALSGMACGAYSFVGGYGDIVSQTNVDWCAQSLSVSGPQNVRLFSINMNSTISDFKVDWYTDYDSADGGTFTGFLGSDEFSVTASSTKYVNTSIDLIGADDNIYYAKFSRSGGGTFNTRANAGDDGSDPLRQGTAGCYTVSWGYEPVTTPTYDMAYFSVAYDPIPEPTTVSLIGLGAVALLRCRRKKYKRLS